MKTLVLLLFCVGAAVAAADDNLLQNGDFSDGIAHWYGDCHTVDSDSLGLSTPASAPGVLVKLRDGEWTKVIQDFDGKAGIYTLKITYSASPDLAFSTNADDYTNLPAKIDFSRLRAFNTVAGRWVVIVNDLGAMHFHYWEITPNPNAPGLQSVTAMVQLKSDDAEKKGFYLLFPPGQGVITLHSITLASKTSPSTSTP